MTRTTIVVRTRAVLFLLLATTAGLPLGHWPPSDVPAGLLITGDAIARCELDFQFDDFIPLFIRAVTLRNRQQVTQATPIVVRRHHNGRIFRRIFGIRCVHRKLKAEPVQDEPRMR